MYLLKIFSLVFVLFFVDGRVIENVNSNLIRERREVEVAERFGGNPFIGGVFAAGKKSGSVHAASEKGYLSAAGGSQFVDAGDFSKVAASKSSSSSSSKTSKIKNSSSFGGGGSSVNYDQFGSSQLGKLNYGASEGYYGNKGIYGGVDFAGGRQENLGVVQASSLHGSKQNAQSGYFGGSSNTEVEQSESNQNSQSESYVASQGSHLNAGSQYGALNKGYASDSQAANYDQSFLVSQ